MTRVDFYVLPELAPDTANPTANPLGVLAGSVTRAAAARQSIYVYAPDTATADKLDGMLWSFRQGSFIAHERFNGGAIIDPPLPPGINRQPTRHRTRITR